MLNLKWTIHVYIITDKGYKWPPKMENFDSIMYIDRHKILLVLRCSLCFQNDGVIEKQRILSNFMKFQTSYPLVHVLTTCATEIIKIILEKHCL